MHSVARLALHPHITNIQASWVKMGPERAAALLSAGCNDMGGSIMNESITKAAGIHHGLSRYVDLKSNPFTAVKANICHQLVTAPLERPLAYDRLYVSQLLAVQGAALWRRIVTRLAGANV